MVDITTYRQCFATEIGAVANVKTTALVDALAAIPRERYLASGPSLVRGETDWSGPD